MLFGFAWDSSETGLLTIDLLDTHLDSLDTDIPRKHCLCLKDVFKTCLQDVFKTPLQDVFKASST